MAGEEPRAWQAAAEDAPEYVLLVDRELRVRFINHLQPNGPNPVGAPLMEFIAEPDRAHLREAIAGARASAGPRHCTVMAPGPRGTLAPYSVWVLPVGRAADPEMLALVCADLGEQRRTEQALEGERGVLRSLLDNAPDHVMILDRQRRVLFANRFRYVREEEMIGAPVERAVPEAQRERVRAAIESVFEQGAGTSYEVRLDTPVGPRWFSTRVGPVLVDGRVERVSLVSTDITANKQKERERRQEREALRQSEARFRTLIECAPEAVVILDAETGAFSHVNERACEFFELPREALLAKGPMDLSPELQADGRPSEPRIRSHIEGALSGHEQVFEWLCLTASGRARPCEVRLVRLPDAERALVRGSLIDISERKRAELDRARLQEELFHAQKTQAIGQLTGGVAHDFNNLLTVVMSHTELLDVDADNPEEVRAHSREILAASRRAAALTQQLLAFARRQPLQPRVVDLGVLVGRMEQLLRRTLGEAVQVVTTTSDAQWPCEVDPAQLENALLNLAINARDAMPEGGRLHIRAGNQVLEAREDRDGATVRAGQYAVLSVEDEGCGIAPEMLDRVFEPFFTTKEVGSGSGLGLSTVYGFVKQSGGHIEVRSEPGQGTRIDIFLPRGDGGVPAELPAPEPKVPPRGQGETILVVEDEAPVRAVTVARLQRLGYRTLEAADAAAGLEVLSASPQVSLLLTDVVLPGGVNGEALIRRAHGLRPGLPVVFMSGYPDTALAADGSMAENAVLVKKPIDFDTLAQALRTALDGG